MCFDVSCRSHGINKGGIVDDSAGVSVNQDVTCQDVSEILDTNWDSSVRGCGTVLEVIVGKLRMPCNGCLGRINEWEFDVSLE